MKKNIINTVLYVILITICIFVLGAKYGEINYKTHTYALTAVVVEIDKAQDIVTVEDYNGNLWQFTGVEDWERNDCVGLIMNDNLTDNIYDDEIVSVKYQGWNVEY